MMVIHPSSAGVFDIVMKIGYDSAGRLTTVWENGLVTGTYGYDENGNRSSHGGLLATYCQVAHCFTGFIGVMIYGFG